MRTEQQLINEGRWESNGVPVAGGSIDEGIEMRGDEAVEHG